MEPFAPASTDAGTAFARRFRERSEGVGKVLSFADFMDLALFDREVGYYAARRRRIGTTRGTDFYTSTTFAAAFGPLVAAAVVDLLGDRPAAGHVFVEIGAEPERTVLDNVSHPFGGTRAVRLGDPLAIPAKAVVFSNELFDAQPFHRLVRRNHAWREMGVALDGIALRWTELPALSPELDAIAPTLPGGASDGYMLDVPCRTVALLERIAAGSWHGAFLAFDYGRTWAQLCTELPQGTGRAYAGHRQPADLLGSPGEQDLTCHVCWDWLEHALRKAGFTKVQRESQEAFFVKHAAAAIESIMRSDRNPLSPSRSQLKQLLHPGLMGHRFEALWGTRG